MQTAIMPREHGFNKPCYWLILTKSLIPRNSLWLVYDLSDLETSMNIRNKIDQEIKIYVSPSLLYISIIHQSWNYSFYYLFITLHLFIISLSLSLDHPVASTMHLKSLLFMHSQNFSMFRIWIYIYILHEISIFHSTIHTSFQKIVFICG